MNSPKIAVVGAGISGLTTAYLLMKSGYNVTVYEKESRAGGTIISEHTNGFLIDLGPNTALETSTELKSLMTELGLDEQKIYGDENSNKRYILRNGRLCALPMSPPAFIRTPLFSWQAKLRLFREPFIARSGDGDISLADLVRRRLGQEFLDYAINPFVAGVYAGDPETLSAPAAFPKLYALEKNYGSFIKGAIRGKKERKKRGEVSKDRAKLFSFRDGMQVFTDTLAHKLGERLKLNTEVEHLDVSVEHGFKLTLKNIAIPEVYDALVLSTPTDSLSGFIKPLHPEAAKKIANITYPPVAVVFMGFKSDQISQSLDGFGFLIPKIENRQILGSLWSSSLFPGRAPEGHVALTSFVGGSRQPDLALLTESEISILVHNDLKEILGIRGKPVFERIKQWPRAIPQYELGYPAIQKMFCELESQFTGLYFAGNFRRGISVGDSVLCAFETADKIIQELYPNY